MSEIYNVPQFIVVREKIAHALNNQIYTENAIQLTNEITNNKTL